MDLRGAPGPVAFGAQRRIRLGQATQAGAYATGAQYFPNGALKQFTYGNGIVHTMVQNARQLPASSTDTGGALSQQFTYDRNGNVTGVTDALDSARSKTMTYDSLDRLTSATSTSFGGNGTHQFAYDPLDNLRSWTLGGVKDQSNYVYGADNRLAQVKNTGGGIVHSFGYDPQGNASARNTVPHDFDYGNRLRSVGTTETYRYDGHGRRVQTTQGNGSLTLWMYAQSGQMLFSFKGPSNQTTHENVYLAGSLVATIDHAWPSNAVTATKYQHTDALGSPVAISDASGTIIERTNYDPYGGPIGKAVNGMGYTGHVMDGATGLTYMQQRYYDPAIGRFLSVDPVLTSPASGSNFSRYWYGNSNPYRFADPDGRYVCSGTDGGCARFAQALDTVKGAAESDRLSTEERGMLKAVVEFYGKEGEDNRVQVRMFDQSDIKGGTATIDKNGISSITVNLRGNSDRVLARIVAHEGKHGVDDKERKRSVDNRSEWRSHEIEG